MESRSVYLGIATRLRGNAIGVLDRIYLHSHITESLWYDVVENERWFSANLSHAVMLASLYGHPSADIEKGNDQVHEMYMTALSTVPYFKPSAHRTSGDTQALIERWRELNEKKPAAEGEEAS